MKFFLQRVNKTNYNYIIIRVLPDGKREMYSREHGWRPNQGELFTKATAMYLYNSFKPTAD